MMGAPVPSDNLELWKNAKEVVAGRLVNCYTKDDWVLGRLQKEKELLGEW